MLQKRTHRSIINKRRDATKLIAVLCLYIAYIYFNKKTTYILKESHTNKDYIRKIYNQCPSDACGTIMQHALYMSLATFFSKINKRKDKLQKSHACMFMLIKY